MTDRAAEANYAAVYDVIHESEPAFLRTQLAFLEHRLGGCQALLDAGCGTGRHLAALARAGFRMTGLDASQAMLAVAQTKPGGPGPSTPLVHGLLQALPFSPGAFDGALCLESPLAYLFAEEELERALAELRRVLRPGGRLVIDVFDYPGTLGADRRLHKAQLDVPWGQLEVIETHHYRPGARIWRMTQTFVVRRGGIRREFTVEHRLRVRSADDYAAALERTGFTIRELLPAYPGFLPEVASETRFIFVASG
jgi:SAM-dependent methyltransferase